MRPSFTLAIEFAGLLLIHHWQQRLALYIPRIEFKPVDTWNNYTQLRRRLIESK